MIGKADNIELNNLIKFKKRYKQANKYCLIYTENRE